MSGIVILTPEDRPDHHTIGQRFQGFCHYDMKIVVYYCDSHQSNYGYWMTREDCPPEHRQDEEGKWRKNVSERAIGRTYHRIYE